MSEFRLLSVMMMVSMMGCSSRSSDILPILGETSIDARTGETVYYQAPSFSLIDQVNEKISEEDLKGKVHVVDFFFTSCPTICPKMTHHLTKVQEHFLEEDRLRIISFSIDPGHDSPERLADYATHYNINESKWSLLTGNETDVFELAKDYKIRAFDDSNENERNLIHDGTFVLVDDQRRIRGYYDGLQEPEVDRLIGDIGKLLQSI